MAHTCGCELLLCVRCLCCSCHLRCSQHETKIRTVCDWRGMSDIVYWSCKWLGTSVRHSERYIAPPRLISLVWHHPARRCRASVALCVVCRAHAGRWLAWCRWPLLEHMRRIWGVLLMLQVALTCTVPYICTVTCSGSLAPRHTVADCRRCFLHGRSALWPLLSAAEETLGKCVLPMLSPFGGRGHRAGILLPGA
jgi:hypothetical protein